MESDWEGVSPWDSSRCACLPESGRHPQGPQTCVLVCWANTRGPGRKGRAQGLHRCRASGVDSLQVESQFMLQTTAGGSRDPENRTECVPSPAYNSPTPPRCPQDEVPAPCLGWWPPLSQAGSLLLLLCLPLLCSQAQPPQVPQLTR